MRAWVVTCAIVGLAACAPVHRLPPPPPNHEQLVACGRRFIVGRRVLLWNEPGAFNGYTDPPHFNDRITRDGGPVGEWSLDRLRRTVDQVVIHYDAAGSSRRCFEILQQRGLSVHFMIDVDGTIYQTLDLKERAWHASVANSRSVGIELAHVGATQQPQYGRLGVVAGTIQGQSLYQQPFTDAQYDALIDLVAALRRALPRVELNYPPEKQLLTPQRFAHFRGLIGHYHVSEEKVDPGPAFDWDRVIAGVRRATTGQPRK